MHQDNTIQKAGIVGLVFFWMISFHTLAQNFFKFPITQAGVYRLDMGQVRGLGFDDIDEVAIFGNPGMLPQQLDSADLKLREIPVKKIGESLYFFVEGPHLLRFQNDRVQYFHHHYADTLYYLLGPRESGKAIVPSENTVSTEPKEEFSLHWFQALKWEDTNLINSGRSWFSKPIFGGQTFTFGFDLPANVSGTFQVELALMSQAVAEGKFRINASGQTIADVTIAAIPNTTYGIKGRESKYSLPFTSTNPTRINFNLLYQTTDANGTGYIDYAVLNTSIQSSSLSPGVYFFMENQTSLKWPEALAAWDVSDFYSVKELSEENPVGKGQKLAVFDPANTPNIERIEPANLSLRNGSGAELLILTQRNLVSQAQRLASHKAGLGIQAEVFTLDDIYTAFGYGTNDITAVRNFIAFHYHIHGKLKNVLILGKGTYDYKAKLGGRPNIFPVYTSRNSLNPLTTYSSDDFFGFLEWGQGLWIEDQLGDELLRIGVGRLPAINLQEASEMVDKIISYETPLQNPGTWKRKLAFLADDGDNNIHLRDAELHAEYLSNNHPEFEIQKLYLDRYEQIKNGNSQTSPEAREALTKTIEEGVLLLNYIGHGNETTLTAERIFSTLDLIDWPSNPLLPLFVTATCEFGRHDSPFSRSGAEQLMIAEKKGAIALLTTGRPVFSSVNFALNKAFIETVFEKENLSYKDLGSIFKITKNNSLNGTLNRNFSLLGDPSLKLALPELQTAVNDIFQIDLAIDADTLRPLQEFRLEGSIVDPSTGATLLQANGEFLVKISDKAQTQTSLGDESDPTDFGDESITLFQGTGEVNNGRFVANFVLPEGISPEPGDGRIRLFAMLPNLGAEAMSHLSLPVTHEVRQSSQDMNGPVAILRYGPEKLPAPAEFQYSAVPLYIELDDPSGINISTLDPSKNIQLRINGGQPLTLNHLYVAKNGNFQTGEINTRLPDLQEGPNQITLKAWDNAGNSTELTETITIRGSQEVELQEVIAYPNPATEVSKFKIKHNRPGETLRVELEIYSILGSKIYSDGRRYINADFELEAPEWNFFHSSSQYPVKGTYIYRLLLISEKDSTTDFKSGKIIIK